MSDSPGQPPSDPGQPERVGEDLRQIQVLAFRLVGEQVRRTPQLVERTVASPQFREAVDKYFFEHSLTLLRGGLTPPAGTENNSALAWTLATDMGGVFAGQLGDRLLESIRGSFTFRQLQTRVQTLGRDFRATPTGIFFDRHSTTLYVVGGVLGVAAAAGAGAALYYEAGDKVAPLLENHRAAVSLGSFSLDGTLLNFRHEQGSFGLELGASKRWGPVKTRLALGGLVTRDSTDGNATLETTVDLGGHVSLLGSARIGPGANLNLFVPAPMPTLGPIGPSLGGVPAFGHRFILGIKREDKAFSFSVMGQVENGTLGAGLSSSLHGRAGPFRYDLLLNATGGTPVTGFTPVGPSPFAARPDAGPAFNIWGGLRLTY